MGDAPPAQSPPPSSDSIYTIDSLIHEYKDQKVSLTKAMSRMAKSQEKGESLPRLAPNSRFMGNLLKATVSHNKRVQDKIDRGEFETDQTQALYSDSVAVYDPRLHRPPGEEVKDERLEKIKQDSDSEEELVQENFTERFFRNDHGDDDDEGAENDALDFSNRNEGIRLLRAIAKTYKIAITIQEVPSRRAAVQAKKPPPPPVAPATSSSVASTNNGRRSFHSAASDEEDAEPPVQSYPTRANRTFANVAAEEEEEEEAEEEGVATTSSSDVGVPRPQQTLRSGSGSAVVAAAATTAVPAPVRPTRSFYSAPSSSAADANRTANASAAASGASDVASPPKSRSNGSLKRQRTSESVSSPTASESVEPKGTASAAGSGTLKRKASRGLLGLALQGLAR